MSTKQTTPQPSRWTDKGRLSSENVYRIGRLGRTHGAQGEISFQFDDDVFDRVDADYLILEVDGILVPFFLEEYRFRSDSTALVKFCDIDTQERARELTNCDVFFPLSLTEEEAPLTMAVLVGYEVIDATTNKTVGAIAAIDDSTPNLLFELEDGTLIPASDDLVSDIDRDHRTITMELPEGLLEL